MSTLYTIGHSTRPLEEFVGVLHAHSIKSLVDIRAFPVSRRLPHFNRETLEQSLPTAGIQYVWMKTLGGYRKKTRDDSPHIALHSETFRNYADYMLTAEFQSAVNHLVSLAQQSWTAYMCAERHYANCHRRMVSDWLASHQHKVLHIDDISPANPHEMAPEARLVEGELIYRGDLLF